MNAKTPLGPMPWLPPSVTTYRANSVSREVGKWARQGSPMSAGIRVRTPIEEGCDPLRKVRRVEEVADENHVGLRRRVAGCEILAHNGNRRPVELHVELERSNGVRVHLRRDHCASAGLCGGNPDQTRSRAKIEHPQTGHDEGLSST